MGTEANQTERGFVRFLIDKKEIGFQMAFAMMGIFPGQEMIAVFIG